MWPVEHDQAAFEHQHMFDEWQFSWGELQGRLQMCRRVGIEFGEPWPSYAWPGGYVIGYFTDDGETICGECMNEHATLVHFRGITDGWRIDAADTIEESEYGEFCSHCNKVLIEGYSDSEVIL